MWDVQVVEDVSDANAPATEALEGLLTADLPPHPNIAQTLDHMFFIRVSLISHSGELDQGELPSGLFLNSSRGCQRSDLITIPLNLAAVCIPVCQKDVCH